ncbi:hypothetical protein [Paenibacillus sp. JCM 10914]
MIRMGAILITLWLLAGCGVPATPLDTIKPPLSEASMQRNETSQELIKLLPDKAQLLAPLQGAGGHDISFGDLDGDGIDEAVVVYEDNKGTGNTLKAALFRQHNEAWQKISEVYGFGYGLEYVGILDVNHDGINELVLGWSLGDAGNGLDIYRFSEDQLKLLSNKVYDGNLDLE